MEHSNQGKRSLRSRLLNAVPRFRSRSPSQLPQPGGDEASAQIPASQADSATSSAQTPPTPNNAYATIGGLPTTTVDPTVGSVVYEGLKTVLQGLYDCSDMFLPLKTTAGALLTIFRIVDVRGFEAWFMNCYLMNNFCGLDGVREQNGTRRS